MPAFLLMPQIAATDEFLSSTDKDLREHAKDAALVAEFAEAVARWHSLVIEVTGEHRRRVGDYFSGHSSEVGGADSSGGSPEDEIALWETEEARLGVYLQLSTQPVLLVLRVISEGASEEAKQRRDQLLQAGEELRWEWEATADAVKYLCSLRPYVTSLRAISEGARLSEAVDTIPCLFGALRMVWTCSKTYGAGGGEAGKARFFGMLRKLCSLAAEGAAHHLRGVPAVMGRDMIVRSQVPTIGEASRDHREQKQLVLHAADTCTTLKEEFYRVKLNLEESRGAAWDFAGEEELFDHADFCYERATELLGVLDSLAECWARYLQRKKDGHKRAAIINALLEDTRQELHDVSFDFLAIPQLERWRVVLDRYRERVGELEALMSTPAAAAVEGDGKGPMLALYKSLGKPAEKPGVPFSAASREPTLPPRQMIVLSLAFNPPEIAILGPIRDKTVEGLSDAVPRAFTSTTSRTLFGKSSVPQFVRRRIGDDQLAGPHEVLSADVERGGGRLGWRYWHLSAEAHFCSDQVGQSAVFLALFDALEREGSWRLRDTHAAYLPLSGGGYKAHYKFFFSKPAPAVASAP